MCSSDLSYNFELDPDKTYSIQGNKSSYTDDERQIDINDGDVIMDLKLEKKLRLSLYCIVTEATTGDTMEGVTVKLRDTISDEIISFVTSETGDFTYPLLESTLNDTINYEVIIEKEGFLTKKEWYFKVLDKEGTYNLHEELNVTLDKIEVGLDLAKIIDIKPIYFDLGKYNIREDAAVELDKIVKVMEENLTMEVELGSHTDCRGSAISNERLSDNRAKSSAQYIKERITNPDRIYGKGFGENKLVNECECEGTVTVYCSEEQHQENRRTEFTIIKM